MQFNFDFSNNIILPCVFFFFLIIESYFLSPAVIAQSFNTIAIKEAKAEKETHPVIVEAKIRKFSI